MLNHALSIGTRKSLQAIFAVTLALGALGTGCVASVDEVAMSTGKGPGMKIADEEVVATPTQKHGGFVSPGDFVPPDGDDPTQASADDEPSLPGDEEPQIGFPFGGGKTPTEGGGSAPPAAP
jgi:hypothetical protein